MFGQQIDDKMVSFISMLVLVLNGVICCQCGKDKVEFMCPRTFQVYKKLHGLGGFW